MTVCSPWWSANIINVGRMSGNAGVRWGILPAGSALVATGDFTRATGELRQSKIHEACTRFKSAAMFECVKSTVEDFLCNVENWRPLQMALLVENMGLARASPDWHGCLLETSGVCVKKPKKKVCARNQPAGKLLRGPLLV